MRQSVDIPVSQRKLGLCLWCRISAETREKHTERQATQHGCLPSLLGDRDKGNGKVYGEEKNIICCTGPTRAVTAEQKSLVRYRHDEPNEPSKNDPKWTEIFVCLFRGHPSPHSPQFQQSQGPPLSSLSGWDNYEAHYCWNSLENLYRQPRMFQERNPIGQCGESLGQKYTHYAWPWACYGYFYIYTCLDDQEATNINMLDDPEPDPDLHVYGPPGSESIGQRSGSWSESFPFLINVLSGLK